MSLGFILKMFLNNDVENSDSTVLKYILIKKSVGTDFFERFAHLLMLYRCKIGVILYFIFICT